MTPRDARFAKRFLVVTPGHHDPRPARGAASRARGQLLPRARPRAARPVGCAAPGADPDRQLPHVPAARREGDPGRLRKHPQAAARRAARRTPTRSARRPRWSPRASCAASAPRRARSSSSTTRRITATRTSCSEHPDEDADKEDRGAQPRGARLVPRAPSTCAARSGSRAIYDLSATPYYLKGSGYNEGFIFPWVVSDFSLMDAIESGIVKVPRDPGGRRRRRREAGLPATCGTTSSRRFPSEGQVGNGARPPNGWVPPVRRSRARCSACTAAIEQPRALRGQLAALGEPPPVMIVVCPNTLVSKLVFDWIAGREVELPTARNVLVPGQPPAALQRRGRRLGNPAADDPRRLRPARVRRAAQRRVQEGRGARDRGVQAGLPPAQPGRRRRQADRRGPAARGDEHDRQEGQARRAHPLRRVGGDAHRGLGREHRHPHPRHPAVPQPAAVRAGRRPRAAPAQLRRRPETGRFEPEYAEVYGVPFAFIPGDRTVPEPKRSAARDRGPRTNSTESTWRSASPSSTATGSSCPTSACTPTSARTRSFTSTRQTVALWVRSQGLVGAAERGRPRGHPRRAAAAGRLRAREDADRAGRQFFGGRRRRPAAVAVPAARLDLPAMAGRVRHDRAEGSRSATCCSRRRRAEAARRCSARSSACPGAARAGADAACSGASTPRARPTRFASSRARW